MDGDFICSKPAEGIQSFDLILNEFLGHIAHGVKQMMNKKET